MSDDNHGERMARLETRFDGFIDRYDRDHTEAKTDRDAIKSTLKEITEKMIEVRGAMKAAAAFRWAIVGIASVAGLIGGPKFSAAILALAK